MNANLLTDPVFGIETPEGEYRTLSLPALLEALGQAQVENLTGIQRHQADAVQMFLCYLGVAVLDHAGAQTSAQDEAFWRNGIRALTGRPDDDAWTLVVDDPTRPAFMQPPAPDQASFTGYKPKAATPDEMDVLQAAKNHDLKAARLAGATAEAWALALISTQTMSGYRGKGNYGISRMNSGDGSRPCVATNTSLQPGARWREDVAKFLDLLPRLLSPPWPYTAGGHRLLWLLPWDGQTGLGMDALHPCFIEVCRLIRLVPKSNGYLAMSKVTQTIRIAVADETKGNMGDPWTPLRREDSAVMPASDKGFYPRLLRDLIITHHDLEPAPMQALNPSDGPTWFHASVLVRGTGKDRGKTKGFHEQHIYIAPQAKRILRRGGQQRDRLGIFSDWALETASAVRYRVLKRALFELLEGGLIRKPDREKREIEQWSEAWMKRYDQRWSERYFPWLWQTVEQTDDEAHKAWLSHVKTLALDVLDDALQTAPQRSGRRYRGRVRARGLFHGAFNKHFKEEMHDVAD